MAPRLPALGTNAAEHTAVAGEAVSTVLWPLGYRPLGTNAAEHTAVAGEAVSTVLWPLGYRPTTA